MNNIIYFSHYILAKGWEFFFENVKNIKSDNLTIRFCQKGGGGETKAKICLRFTAGGFGALGAKLSVVGRSWNVFSKNSHFNVIWITFCAFVK